jgi:hypothetical protein
MVPNPAARTSQRLEPKIILTLLLPRIWDYSIPQR